MRCSLFEIHWVFSIKYLHAVLFNRLIRIFLREFINLNWHNGLWYKWKPLYFNCYWCDNYRLKYKQTIRIKYLFNWFKFNSRLRIILVIIIYKKWRHLTFSWETMTMVSHWSLLLLILTLLLANSRGYSLSNVSYWKIEQIS